ncbi:hypothetical protein [Candidatus Lokiarchaeum ossiferum]|uniref:hypothetical protein n=1 Tax=Candidatus Lokiarchaeum ossiferum TaxID=2951803 RepID=UPI00352D9CA5
MSSSLDIPTNVYKTAQGNIIQGHPRWQYETLEDHQADGHSEATEQEFLDSRKEQLAMIIAHNYGVFDNGDDTWSVKAGSITVDDNTYQIDMRLWWFFFEHANTEAIQDVREGKVLPSAGEKIYQKRFLEELDNNGLLEMPQ